MRPLFVLLFFAIACGSSTTLEEFNSINQNYIGPPSQTITCEEHLFLCDMECVDIANDNLNCGECGKVCRVSQGEFCLGHFCKNVRDYGYYLGPIGPIEYDIKRDLPRPPLVWKDSK